MPKHKLYVARTLWHTKTGRPWDERLRRSTWEGIRGFSPHTFDIPPPTAWPPCIENNPTINVKWGWVHCKDSLCFVEIECERRTWRGSAQLMISTAVCACATRDAVYVSVFVRLCFSVRFCVCVCMAGGGEQGSWRYHSKFNQVKAVPSRLGKSGDWWWGRIQLKFPRGPRRGP